MPENDALKDRFFELMQRFCTLGRLLPSKDEVADGERHDDAEIVLAEMSKVKSEMDAALAKARALREAR